MKDKNNLEPSDYKTSVSGSLNGLEALKNLKEQNKTHRWLEQQFENEWLDTIEKELKALEIIRDRNVAIGLLKITVTLKTYNEEIRKMLHGYDDGKLTQEEYDLLKEVIQ